MRNIKKRALFITMCHMSAGILLLVACSAEKSFTYEVGDGEQVKVGLEANDGYDLRDDDGTIYVSKDGKDVLQGIFITEEGYDFYASEIEETDTIKMLAMEPEESPTLFVYQYDTDEGTEIDFLSKIGESQYASVFSSFAAYDEARAAYDKLVISIAE